MLFTSLEFFLFLPLALAVFGALPASTRWAWLLVASCVFYGWQHPANLVFLAAVTMLVWGCGTLMRRAPTDVARRAWLAGGLVALIGALVAFKFYDFAAGEIERLLRSGALGFSDRIRAAAAGHHGTGGLFVLRLLGRELPRRCVRTAAAGGTSRRSAGAVRGLVPEDLRRPDRTRDHLPAAMARAPDAAAAGARHTADRLGPDQESAHCRQPGTVGRQGIWHRSVRDAGGPPHRRVLLRVPDLLRLLRLHRHRNRRVDAVRHPAGGELPAARISRAAPPSSGASAGTSRWDAGSATISTSRWAAAAPAACVST